MSVVDKRKYIGLDLLRALAATLIVFHHYQQVFKVRFRGINFYGGMFDFGYSKLRSGKSTCTEF